MMLNKIQFTFIVISFFLWTPFASAQSEDCFNRLLNRGIEKFNRGYFEQAKLRWETAKSDCPGINSSQIQILNDWIRKANSPIAKIVDTIINSEKFIVIIKSDTVEKTILKIDTVFVEKNIRAGTVMNKSATKNLHRNELVEKKPYEGEKNLGNEFGKGNGKITIISSYADSDTLRVWIDGNFVGNVNSGYSEDEVECGALGVFSMVLKAGSYLIVVKDQQNRRWVFGKDVLEDQCQKINLK